jgi:hypothetical protein
LGIPSDSINSDHALKDSADNYLLPKPKRRVVVPVSKLPVSLPYVRCLDHQRDQETKTAPVPETKPAQPLNEDGDDAQQRPLR